MPIAFIFDEGDEGDPLPEVLKGVTLPHGVKVLAPKEDEGAPFSCGEVPLPILVKGAPSEEKRH